MKLVKKIESREGALHFRRWSLLSTPWFDLYLHCISRSDEDNDPHDHPFAFTSLVLWGGYRECVWHENGEVVEYVRKPGRWSSRSTSEFHKITLLGRPAWTLVLAKKRTHEPWGYLTVRGWMDHETYREEKRQKG